MGTKEDEALAFWTRVAKVCEEKGWSENELAKAAGLRQSAINGTKNRGGFPRLDTCVALARALGTTIEYLAFGDESMKDRQAVYAERRPALANAGPQEGTVSLALVIPRIIARFAEILQEELLGKKAKDPPEGIGASGEGLSPKEKAPIIKRYKRKLEKTEDNDGGNEGMDNSSQAIG